MKQISFLLAPLAALGLAQPLLAQSTPVPPVAGDLAVSELMFNPGPDACVTDNNGEYFEVTNISTHVLDLNGMFVQDFITSDNTFFQILPSVATLPPLYPGQRFLFCRKGSADSAINGGLTNVDYGYAASTSTPPADRSQVGSAQMNLGNSSTGDGIRLSVGGPLVVPSPNPNGYVAGTLVEIATVVVTSAPFTSSGSGQAAERIDLFQPMQFTGSVNSSNLALSTVVHAMPCGTSTFVGTPREANSVDNTSWPSNTNYDSVSFPNSGTLKFTSPVSVGAGVATFKVTGGPTLAGLPYYLGYAGDTLFEISIDTFLPGNPGSIVIDLNTAVYVAGFSFDGSSANSSSIAIPNNPLLVGAQFDLQWLALDPTLLIILSNGVRITIVD
jgi:hypothetical protein